MLVHRPHFPYNKKSQDQRQSHDHNKRCIPAPPVCDDQTDGYAQHLACGKSELRKTKRTTALAKIEKVCNDGHACGADDSAKQTCEHSCSNQSGIGCRQSTEKCTGKKPGIKEQEYFLSVVSIGTACGKDD